MRTSTVHPDRALEPHGLTSTVINDSTQSVDLKGDDIGDHGSGRAIAGKRRKEVAAQMAVMEQCSDVLFETYDKDGSGVLERSEVHSLMVELNCGLDVSEGTECTVASLVLTDAQCKRACQQSHNSTKMMMPVRVDLLFFSRGGLRAAVLALQRSKRRRI